MAQQKNSRSVTSNTTALLGFSLMILLGGLSQAAWQQSGFSCTALKLGVGTVSYVGLAAWPTIHAQPCAAWVLAGFLHVFEALCPLLANLAGLL